MLDLNRIFYFLTLVDNGFNLSQTARVLHISQPALSISMKHLDSGDSKIFYRDRGRIVGLTRTGRNLYNDAKKVTSDYLYMVQRLNQKASTNIRGTIHLGISSVLNATIFSNALLDFIEENKSIHVRIKEFGSYDLQKDLAEGNLDLVFGISPAISDLLIEHDLFQDEIVIWFNHEHRFHNNKDGIDLDTLKNEKIVTMDDHYMATRELRQWFRDNNLTPDLFLQTTSWSLVLNACQRHSDLLGILPRPVQSSFNIDNLEYRSFRPIWPWTIALYENGALTRNDKHNELIKYTRNWFIKYFKNMQPHVQPKTEK